jgi:putative DNA primase/helicase
MIDFQAINSYILPSLRNIVQSWIPGGRFEGVQYVVKNPNRSDKKPGSFKINMSNGQWKDFSSGESGGDPISLYAFINNLKNGEAAKILSEENNLNNKPIPIVETVTTDTVIPIIPIPDNAPPRPTKFKDTKISEYYEYRDKTGGLICYTCKTKAKGRKEVVPLIYTKNGWRFKSVPKPRPIYGLDQLVKYPKAQVLIVEGEKDKTCADRIFSKINNIIPISWLGGTSGVNCIDWSLLNNRKIVFWPDADTQRDKNNDLLPLWEQPGTKAMISIYYQIKDKIKDARILKLPSDKINGWDIADSGFDAKKALSFIKKHMVKFSEIQKEKKKEFKGNQPFQYLGYNSASGAISYFYLPIGTKRVTSLSPMGHNKQNMMSLAPIEYFEQRYPSRTGANWTEATNVCMRQCEKVGLYDPLRVRGRGAWFDHGRSVLHLGNKLVVNGKVESVIDFKSKYIYEADIPTELDESFMSNILTPKEGRTLIDICDLLSWSDGMSGKLLAGWLAVAPICGAIKWRPHIWVTGESDTGKSWIMDNIVCPILGKMALYVTGNTTEPAIRGALQNNAFPVFYDEIEAESMASILRVQAVLEFARVCSSNKTAAIMKGTAFGKTNTYQPRSCFLFSSINPKLYQQADENRISLLKLVKRKDYVEGNMFELLSEQVVNLITDEFCSKLRARSIKMIPTIRKNAVIMCGVMSKELRSTRHGDQFGTLLAGMYSLISDKVLTKEKAELIAERSDIGSVYDTKGKVDHEKCLDVILESVVRTDSGSETESIGGLLIKGTQDIKKCEEEDIWRIKIEREAAIKTLRNYGITPVKYHDIAIAENNHMLQKLLFGTPWFEGYRIVLSRLKGVKSRTAVFSSGRRQSAMIIPYEVVFPDGDLITENENESEEM